VSASAESMRLQIICCSLGFQLKRSVLLMHLVDHHPNLLVVHVEDQLVMFVLDTQVTVLSEGDQDAAKRMAKHEHMVNFRRLFSTEAGLVLASVPA
jgi:phage terminase large subunit